MWYNSRMKFNWRYPIRFEPQVKHAIWGQETWLVSGHPSRPSVVANGIHAGRTLPELVDEFGAEMLGSAAKGVRFPLLVKVIEARDRLSLQVHPSEASSKVCGGDPKTEVWYMLGAADGAEIFAGLRDGTDRDALAASLHDGSAEGFVARFRVRRGDVMFIPGGLVHSIGGGCRIFELQQTSDTTWRLHDWNRIDANTGLPRELNEREGLDSIDWTLPTPELVHDGTRGLGVQSPEDLVRSDCFRLSALDLATPVMMPGRQESFRILYVEDGVCTVEVDGAEAVPAKAGDSVLVPASTAFTLSPVSHAHLLLSEM